MFFLYMFIHTIFQIEAVSQRFSVEKVILKFSQNSQGNTYVGDFFLTLIWVGFFGVHFEVCVCVCVCVRACVCGWVLGRG